MKKARDFAIVLGILVVGLSAASAYDPPEGASLLGRIYGPWTMGSGASLTEQRTGPWNFLLNPASTAETELFDLALSYTGIADMSGGSQGWGSAAMAAFSLPTSYGVWNGSVRLFSAPGAMTSMPLGTFVTAGGAFPKRYRAPYRSAPRRGWPWVETGPSVGGSGRTSGPSRNWEISAF